jgi:hypothetical protein
MIKKIVKGFKEWLKIRRLIIRIDRKMKRLKLID